MMLAREASAALSISSSRLKESLTAAIALSQRVLQGGQQELDDYLNFLQGGCSKDPLDLLREAGVDMEEPKPVDTALQQFASLVDQLESLLS